MHPAKLWSTPSPGRAAPPDVPTKTGRDRGRRAGSTRVRVARRCCLRGRAARACTQHGQPRARTTELHKKNGGKSGRHRPFEIMIIIANKKASQNLGTFRMLDNDLHTPTTTLNNLLRASRSIETLIRTSTSKLSEYTPPSSAHPGFYPRRRGRLWCLG